MRRFRIVAWSLVALVGSTLAVTYALRWLDPPAMLDRTEPLQPLEGSFSLTTQTGALFTEANLVDKPSVVFFGFTNCPDICPTGLAELTDLLARLGPDAEKLQVLFIAVDSARDTQTVVRDYLTAFDSRILGLTGTKAEIDTAVATFKAFYEIIPGTGPDDYTVNHSAGMFLIDKGKRFVGKLDSHEDADVRLRKLKRLLSQQ